MSKKRFRPLGDIIRMGLIDDGALLRYVVGLLFSAELQSRLQSQWVVNMHAYCKTFYHLLAVQRSSDGSGSSSADRH